MSASQQGRFTIPTRVYLSATERAKLEQLVRSEALDLSELLSELLSTYLSGQAAPVEAEAPAGDALAELRRKRDEARRMAAERAASGEQPGWFHSYLAQLDGEVARLEREVNGP